MKEFTYTGKTYDGRTYTERYTRASRWMKVDYTLSGRPFFRHNGRRYHLDNFTRVELAAYGSGTITAEDGEQVVLEGFESDRYYKPLFVEFGDGCEAVRVYRFEGTETE